MLVRDPNKRYSLKQVRKHPWMQADIKAAQEAKEYIKPKMKAPPVINEQILRVMQSLGIDPVRTADSVKNDSYDHHAAIYFLLADKLSNVPKSKPASVDNSMNNSPGKQQIINPKQSGIAIPGSGGSGCSMGTGILEENIPEHQKRRPSTIAEQATLDSYNPASASAREFQGLRERNINPAVANPAAPHPTAFTAKQTIPSSAATAAAAAGGGVPGNGSSGGNPSSTNQAHRWKTPGCGGTSSIAGCSDTSMPSMVTSGMLATEYTCLTCGQPILENTTSTTSCVKCARLRTRRRNFATQPPPAGTQPAPGVVLHPAPIMQTPSIEESPVIPAKVSASAGTKIRNDSRDSGVSSGSSQDYDLTTPPIEKALIFPIFPPRNIHNPDKPSIPFSQLVRKLSEVEGITPNINLMGGGNKTSLDEGVGLEVADPNSPHLQKINMLQNVRSFERSFESSSHSSGALPLKALAATAPNSRDSSFCTSTESYPYETLDDAGPIHHIGVHPSSNLQVGCGGVGGVGSGSGVPYTPLLQDNNELTQSLPSCNNSHVVPDMDLQTSAVLEQTVQTILQQQNQHYHMVMQQQILMQQAQQQGNLLTVADPTGQRHLMRSPVSFREGRRASDGVVAQSGFVAFHGRLYDKTMAKGYFDVNDVHQEHKALQHQFGDGGSGSNSSSRSGSPNPNESGGGGSAGSGSGGGKAKMGRTERLLRPSISKRISVPENFTYFPTSAPGSSEALKIPGSASGLQQQLLQHRLHQKRQTMPKSGMMLSASARRNLLTRQSGLKGAGNKPYMPQDIFASSAMCGGISSDFLFQPIAEDESGDPDANPDHNNPGHGYGHPDHHQCIPKVTTSSGMVLLAVPTCMSMPSSPTPSILYPPTSTSMLMEQEEMEEVMSIDLTSAQATLTTNTNPEMAQYWQTLPSHMADCHLQEALGPHVAQALGHIPAAAAASTTTTGASCSPSPSRRLNPPTKLDITKVSPSSPNKSPIPHTGKGSCTIEPPPLKAVVSPLPHQQQHHHQHTTVVPEVKMTASSPENMDISPKD